MTALWDLFSGFVRPRLEPIVNILAALLTIGSFWIWASIEDPLYLGGGAVPLSILLASVWHSFVSLRFKVWSLKRAYSRLPQSDQAVLRSMLLHQPLSSDAGVNLGRLEVAGFVDNDRQPSALVLRVFKSDHKEFGISNEDRHAFEADEALRRIGVDPYVVAVCKSLNGRRLEIVKQLCRPTHNPQLILDPEVAFLALKGVVSADPGLSLTASAKWWISTSHPEEYHKATLGQSRS